MAELRTVTVRTFEALLQALQGDYERIRFLENWQGLEHAIASNNTVKEIEIPISDRDAVADLFRGMRTNYTIRKLTLFAHAWGPAADFNLRRMLEENHALEELRLVSRLFGRINAGHVATGLSANNTLKVLQLSLDFYPSTTSADSFAKAIREHKSLEVLEVTLVYFNPRSLAKLLSAVKQNSIMQTFAVSTRGLITAENENCNEMIESFLTRNSTLKNLSVNNIMFGYKWSQHLAKSLLFNKVLVSLDIGHSKCGEYGAKSLAHMLKTNKTLKRLSLRYNGIRAGGALALASALEVNHTLEWLLLDANRIGSKLAKFFFASLCKNKGLRLLGLGKNYFNSQCGEYIAEFIASSKELKYLYLCKNKLGSNGVKPIAEVLKSNTTLHALSLWENRVGLAGMKAIASALEHSSTLLELNLLDNTPLTQSKMNTILDALTVNRSITKLRLFGPTQMHSYSEKFRKGFKRLNDLLERNRQGKLEKFADAFQENATAQWRRSKLFVVGSEGSGKTSTIRTLISTDPDYHARAGPFFGMTHEENQRFTGHRIDVLHCKQTEAGQMRPEAFEDDYVNDLAHRIVSKRLDIENAENLAALVNFREQSRKNLRQDSLIRSLSSRFSKSLRNTSVAEPGQTDAARSRSPQSPKRMRFNRSPPLAALRQTNSRIDVPGNEAAEEEDIEEEEEHVDVEEDVEEVDDNDNEQVDEDEEHEEVPTGGPGGLDHYPVNLSTIDPLNQTYKLNEERLISARKSDDQGELRVDIWDFTTRKARATLHDLFLTEFGVYLVVFNAAKLLEDRDEAAALHAWMQALVVHAPFAKTILVGTFADDLSEDAKASVNKEIESCFGHMDLAKDTASGRSFWCLDNESGNGVESLRLGVRNLSVKQPFVEEQVPLHWMICLEWLLSQKNYAEKEQLDEVADQLGINPKEVEEMLHTFHQVGAVQYFHANVVLSDKIVTNPNWLLSQLCRVIRDLNPRTDQAFASELAHLKSIVLMRDIKRLRTHGIVSGDLLRYLWRGEPVEFLIEAMQHLLLASRWRFAEDAYLIPQMVTTPPTSLEEFANAACTFQFKLLPPGIFERFVCLCVEFLSGQSEEVPEMHAGCLTISVAGKEENAMQLQVQHEESRQAICVFTEDFRDERFVTAVQEMRSMMRKIGQDFKGSQFKWEMYVRHLDEEGEATLVLFEQALGEKKKRMEEELSMDLRLDLFLEDP